MTAMAAYVARFAFWTVLLVGLADAAISFLRVEELLQGIVGETITQDLGRNQYRGPVVHMPLIVLSLILAAVTRTIGFSWLALLVVIAELQIVISRFVFSYEQAFMGDLVRFWYAGLFLFSSAYTLVEDGHVRVDVLYQGLSEQSKGSVNAVGSLLLGLPLCWVVLVIGFGQASSIISSITADHWCDIACGQFDAQRIARWPTTVVMNAGRANPQQPLLARLPIVLLPLEPTGT